MFLLSPWKILSSRGKKATNSHAFVKSSKMYSIAEYYKRDVATNHSADIRGIAEPTILEYSFEGKWYPSQFEGMRIFLSIKVNCKISLRATSGYLD